MNEDAGFIGQVESGDSTPVARGEGAKLRRNIGWLDAWVIGLAGTILVTGVTGPAIAGLGSGAIIAFLLTAVMGCLICLFLAELAAAFPDRAGGLPAYAYVAFARHERIAPHIGALAQWGYWLGWSPVLALNGSLIATYLNALLGLGLEGAAWWPGLVVFVIGGILFIPGSRGIAPGALVSWVLALFSLVPLTLIAAAPFFVRPDLVNWGNLFPLTPNGQGWLTPGGLAVLWQYFFIMTWSTLAIEAAGCYVAECRAPRRDAPRAMVAAGGVGIFMYALVPLAVLTVLGQAGVATDPYAMFVAFVEPIWGRTGVAMTVTMLFSALLLSMNGALLGSARSLYQMSVDGHGLKAWSTLNRHGVPVRPMVLSWLLNTVLAGLLLQVPNVFNLLVVSTMGYLLAVSSVLFGYHKLRNERPELPRPFRLPNWMKYVATALGVFLISICVYGGVQWGAQYWDLGLLVVLMYIPQYL